MPKKTRQGSLSVSEASIISMLQKRFGSSDPRLLLGIGDDAAIVNFDGKQDSARRLNTANQLVTTDLLVEGVHFSLKYSTLAEVGARALSVCLSDISAMGGEPVFAFGVLGVPAGTVVGEVDDLLSGVAQCAKDYGVTLAGGDTVSAPQWIIGFTIIGNVRGTGLTRANAKPGDTIWHSGQLGLSQAGLHKLHAGESSRSDRCITAHLSPRPQFGLGKFLHNQGLATACLDLSDSLSQCAMQLAEASDVGLLLDFSGYPFDPELTRFAKARKRGKGKTSPRFSVPARMQPNSKLRKYASLAEFVLGSAEDYQLLFTAPPAASLQLISNSPVPLTNLGTVVDSAEGHHYRDELGVMHKLQASGFAHLG